MVSLVYLISDIAVFVLKRDVKLQTTFQVRMPARVHNMMYVNEYVQDLCCYYAE